MLSYVISISDSRLPQFCRMDRVFSYTLAILYGYRGVIRAVFPVFRFLADTRGYSNARVIVADARVYLFAAISYGPAESDNQTPGSKVGTRPNYSP